MTAALGTRHIQVGAYPTHNPSNLQFDSTDEKTKTVAPLLNSALTRPLAELDPLRINLFSAEDTGIRFRRTCLQRLSIETPDLARLDGILIHGQNLGKGEISYASRKVIFYVFGASATYELIARPTDPCHHFVKYFQDAVSDEVDVAVINPRGIGRSEGFPSYSRWALDVYATVKALMQMGYHSANIAIVAHSMGGWYSAGAVQMLQAELPEAERVAYVNYNSFDTYRQVIGRYTLGLLSSQLDGTDWNASAYQIIQTLPQDRTRVASVAEDPIIPKSCRLSKKLIAPTSEADHKALVVTVPFTDGTSTLPFVDMLQAKAHNQTPGPEIAAWLKQALGIATVDAVARDVLPQPEIT